MQEHWRDLGPPAPSRWDAKWAFQIFQTTWKSDAFKGNFFRKCSCAVNETVCRTWLLLQAKNKNVQAELCWGLHNVVLTAMYLSSTGSERGCWGGRNGKKAWLEWEIWWRPEAANNETSAGQARSNGGYDCWAGSKVLQTKETENLQRKKEVITDSGMALFWHCANQKNETATA